MIQVSKQTTDSFTREAFWLASGKGELFTWLYLPTNVPLSDTGYLLCPPLGHEYVHTYRTYRKLAETLAARGIPVIRFDLHGAGNSDGDALLPNRLSVWQENIAEQIALLKERTQVKHIGLFGIRMGASLALQACATQKIDQVIVWRPILKGKNYVRELTALSKFSSASNSNEQGFIESGGFVISQQTLVDLELIQFSEDSPLPTKNILAIEDSGHSISKTKKIFLHHEACESFHTHSYDAMMAEPQIAHTPDDVIDKIVSWVSENSKQQANKKHSNSSPQADTILPQKMNAVLSRETYSETVHFIGEQLFSILSEPTRENKKTILILCNSGAVHTVGPNRLYAELSRNLVSQGYITLRLDLHNIGDSVVGDVERDGYPYPDDAKAIRDITETVEFVKNRFPQHAIVVGGVCSGSYWAFKAATQIPQGQIDKLLIINPLTFDWTSTSVLEDPKDQGAVRDKIHYAHSAKSKEKWIKLLKGQVDFKKLFSVAFNMVIVKLKSTVISVLEVLNLLPTKKLAAQLAGIKSKSIETHFVFSSLDPGYELLMLAGGVKVKKMIRRGDLTVDFIRDADHTFSKHIHRQELLEKILKLKL